MEFSVWHVCGHGHAQKIRFRDVDHAYDGSFTLLHYAIYSFRSRLRVRDRPSNCPRVLGPHFEMETKLRRRINDLCAFSDYPAAIVWIGDYFCPYGFNDPRI